MVSSRVVEAALPQNAWIAIELTDEFGAPVPAEPFRIEADDGTLIVAGTLDEAGCARIEALTPEDCRIVFTQRDPAWFRPDTPPDPPAVKASFGIEEVALPVSDGQ
jgi:hypothetical protein